MSGAPYQQLYFHQANDMAQRVIMAMEQNDWRTRKVLHKHSKRQPLVDLQNQYKFTPRQPMLSSKTVDIDFPGTRTYQARSTDQILDDHHKVIHKINSRARSASSAPPGRIRRENSPHSPRSSVKVLGLSFLTSAGQIKTLINKDKPCRPHTSPGTRRILHELSHLFAQGNSQQAPTAEDIYNSEEACRIISQLIQNHWADQAVKKDFHGGRNPISSAITTPRQGHWVDETGSPLPDSEINVLESIVDFQSGDELYTTIDDNSSKSISRQLLSGEGIHVGINGTTPSARRSSHIHAGNMSHKSQQDGNVPLCWTDQVTKPGALVLQPRHSAGGGLQKNTSDTQSVVFHRLAENKPSQNPRQQNKRAGYGVKMRSKPRTGLDGAQSNSRITSVTIEKLRTEEETEMSVEDVLQKCIPKKTTHVRREGKQKHKEIVHPVPPATEHFTHRREAKPSSNPTPNKLDHHPSIPNKGGDDDHRWDTLFITNANPETIDTKSRRSSVSRGSSAGRRPSSKPSRNKSSSAISQPPKPSFIQITTGLKPKGHLRELHHDPSTKEVMKKVQKHNDAKDDDNRVEDIPQAFNTQAAEQPTENTAPVNATPHTEVKTEVENPDENLEHYDRDKLSTVTPPPTPQQVSPDIKYAFNIPTADNMDYERDSSIYPSDQVSQVSNQTHSIHRFKATSSHSGDLDSKVDSTEDISRCTTPFTDLKSEVDNN